MVRTLQRGCGLFTVRLRDRQRVCCSNINILNTKILLLCNADLTLVTNALLVLKAFVKSSYVISTVMKTKYQCFLILSLSFIYIFRVCRHFFIEIKCN